MSLPGLVAFGAGCAAFPGLAQLALAGVADKSVGVAGGVINSGQQLGGAVGLAAVAASLGVRGTGYQAGLTTAVLFIGGAVLAALILARPASA